MVRKDQIKAVLPRLNCAGQWLDLSSPKVMGVLNITPDSFFDGGFYYQNLEVVLKTALQMQASGAAIIDIGGESTRPGSLGISVQEEIDRVIPVIELLRKHLSIPLSIDTRKTEVMEVAIAAGVNMINDIQALSAEGALDLVKKNDVAICLMHMQGEPKSMQQQPTYQDVVKEVYAFLEQRVQMCLQAGIAKERLVIDPGFGFGKTPAHNWQLLKHLSTFKKLNLPILAGWSRKSTLSKLLNRPSDQLLYASIAAAVLAACEGAVILRVHDVLPTVDAMKVYEAVSTMGEMR